MKSTICEELGSSSDNYKKFVDPLVTANGQPRASVELRTLDTLWFNTGTLCNLTCDNCYIESSPLNDRLVYLTAGEVGVVLDELDKDWDAQEIGFTGGEPFMNPDIVSMLRDGMQRGYRVLVLTNAMRPMKKLAESLIFLNELFPKSFNVRVSLDHYSPKLHELKRGLNSWNVAMEGLRWLNQNKFHFSIAGRTVWNEEEGQLRMGYRELFDREDIDLDAFDAEELVLFPEMDITVDVPEITDACWEALQVSPNSLMCANSRMVVRRKGAAHLSVYACTLLPYDKRFDLGLNLYEANQAVRLNHPHCSKFCVLGGGQCTVNSA